MASPRMVMVVCFVEARQLTVCGTALTLAVIAVIITDNEGVRVDRVLDGAAETVTAETHDGSCVSTCVLWWWWWLVECELCKGSIVTLECVYII